MRHGNQAFVAIAAAMFAMAYAAGAQSQILPGGAVPYRTNRPAYQTNAPVAAHAVVGAATSGCAPSPARTHPAPNPGTAGPALTGNANNCVHTTPSGAVKIGPH